jgi:hypothetical protein
VEKAERTVYLILEAGGPIALRKIRHVSSIPIRTCPNSQQLRCLGREKGLNFVNAFKRDLD